MHDVSVLELTSRPRAYSDEVTHRSGSHTTEEVEVERAALRLDDRGAIRSSPDGEHGERSRTLESEVGGEEARLEVTEDLAAGGREALARELGRRRGRTRWARGGGASAPRIGGGLTVGGCT